MPKPAVFSGALPVAGSGASVTTLTAIVFAFLGGLILNLMPCVFPILSLKILQLIEGYRRGERLLPHGIAFTGGVLVTLGLPAPESVGRLAPARALRRHHDQPAWRL